MGSIESGMHGVPAENERSGSGTESADERVKKAREALQELKDEMGAPVFEEAIKLLDVEEKGAGHA